jgi:hypothetical protein
MITVEQLRFNRYNTIEREVEFCPEENYVKIDLSKDGFLRHGFADDDEQFIDLDGGPFIKIGEYLIHGDYEGKIVSFIVEGGYLHLYLEKS